jgi:hypothetical protein
MRNACRYVERNFSLCAMKTRKNLLLSKEAVARGERLAAARATSLSKIVEEQLLSIIIDQSKDEHYWSGPPLQPSHVGETRGTNL